MGREDIQHALSLINVEGWNYTSEEIERMLNLDPGGSFLYGDKPPLAVVTCVTYGRTGVIGHLVVSQSARGQKIGRAMLQKAIDYCDSQGVDSILLYATDEGAMLYEKFGFRTLRRTHCTCANTTEGAASRNGPVCELVKPDDLEEILEIDSRLFGDDRSKLMRMLLSEYPQHSYKLERDGKIVGFALGRGTSLGFDFGPWVCLTGDITDAESLFNATMSSFGAGTVFLGVFTDNPRAMEIADRMEKIRTWETRLMISGKDRYSSHIEHVFGVAAFELG
ncbi:MAG: GNAT family N-acetyltransferase [Thermoplasmatota archaeon]|nr:GNAT family N-acetyltransferase [Candidatus Thermoplasmatota archaeon]